MRCSPGSELLASLCHVHQRSLGDGFSPYLPEAVPLQHEIEQVPRPEWGSGLQVSESLGVEVPSKPEKSILQVAGKPSNEKPPRFLFWKGEALNPKP